MQILHSANIAYYPNEFHTNFSAYYSVLIPKYLTQYIYRHIIIL